MSVDAIGVKVSSSEQNFVAVPTSYRVTPTPGPTFGEIMKTSAMQLLRGAVTAVNVLPVPPIIAGSVRASAGLSSSAAAAVSQDSAVTSGGSIGGDLTAEGANADLNHPVGNQQTVENALSRSQDINMYMIALQERVSSQNRAFTTYSNVLKAKHDTVKNAINNIR